jgi:ribosomal-protein-alanine N-acetyltransferase
MTETIDVVPASVAELDALLHGDEAYRRLTGLRPAEGWSVFAEALTGGRALLAAGVEPRWTTHLVIHPGDRALIGTGGYKGPPLDGDVEIGYAIAPGYRGRGYATHVAATLVARARAAGVRTVVAYTLATENPSVRVLLRCGFVRTAQLHDPDEGPVWRWELGP